MASSTVDNVESPSLISNPSAGEDEKSSINNFDEQHRKLFIGGLSYTTTDDKLKEYCSKYGEILECVIMRDREGRSRGFAFVSFKDRVMIDNFMAYRPHIIDGRQIEPKRAMPREETLKSDGQLTVKKIFIGAIKDELTDDDLKSYFQKFGNIIECKIMKTKEDKFRGFAFITFDDYDSVDCCILEKPHRINGKELDVRKAIPRERTSRLNSFILNNNINNPNLNTDFYQLQNRYPTHLMINHPTLSFPAFSPYAYFPPSNYLSKPMPLMGTTATTTTTTNACPQSGVVHPPTFILPPELTNSALFRNQTITSPPPSTLSSVRTNNNNSTQNQNETNNKMSNDTTLDLNDPSRNRQLNIVTTGISNYATPIRSKPRSTHHSSTTNDPNSEQHRKLFIGGLSFKTTDETLKEYVTKFGEVSDSLVMKDQNGQSRCFGFVTFTDPQTIDEFMKQRPHTLDGRQIDPKRAMPREEANNDEVHLTVKKIFIGGIRDGLNEDALRTYFEKFGHVNDCFIMHDKDGKTRGFAFLEFDDFDSVDKVILSRPHIIGEYHVDVKKAVPKDQRQIQTQHQQQQQQLQHQQYALQMQAAAAYQYYYNNSPYNFLTNGSCTFPISSPTSLITHNGSNNVGLDDAFSRLRTSSNNNNISNSLRYIPTRNNRRQSSRGSQ
ncbi:unnamed protein product [Rotaria sordida]|uniref:RRM domain-containing protein n=1 Tax=Rotaria sordida TaxID=392033 RepID=A0A815MQL4_9BILA|nr:unnamed protein product [Rotaria sordida]CAF3943466.1 unnamed protein product [Rotaria sordida]